VWGTTWVASKIGIQGIHPLFFSAIRQTLGGSCFLLFFLVTGKAVMPSPKQLGQMLVLAILLFVASNGLTTWGIKYISSGLGAILGATFPLVVAIIDLVSGHHKKPSLLALIGLVLGFAGVAVIFYDHLADFANPDFRFGIILSFIAACTWAVGTIITARGQTGLNRYYALGMQMFLAGIILFIISNVFGLTMPIREIPAHTWKALTYMVILGSVITFGAMLYSLQHLPTTVASLYAYFNPMVAVIAGHILLNEPWSLVLLAGAIITIFGVFLVNYAYRNSIDD
jgi:drug/metabolite transporter (DMT)-like permease